MTRILVVDDESVFTVQLSELLTSMGYDVVGMASDGAEAVEMTRNLRPNLVLMDIRMPGKMDGITAAQKIRSGLGIPVVFLSAHTEDELVERAKLTDPFGYLPKPFDPARARPTIEIALYKHEMETRLKEALDGLETQVKERTSELNQANKALKKREVELELNARKMEELNTALKVLLKKRDEDRAELEERVLFNVKALVMPFMDRLKKTPLTPVQETYVSVIESNLNDIVAPFSPKLPEQYLHLTPTEIQVANLVRQGKDSKEIADMMGLSKRTIEYHRDRIRKKTGIKNKKMNLRTHLMTLS